MKRTQVKLYWEEIPKFNKAEETINTILNNLAKRYVQVVEVKTIPITPPDWEPFFLTTIVYIEEV